jgi:glutamate carboxypeptidase
MKQLLFIFCFFPFLTFANREQDRLETIVRINSGSANIKGVKQVLELVKPWFEELKFEVSFISNPLGETTSAPLFVAERMGEKSEFITFIMHADTVFEPSSPFQHFKVDGDIINGPGVMDDKGGIVMIARTLEMLLSENKTPKYSLRVIISPNEEVGSPGFGKVFKDFSEKSWLVLGLEPAYDDGGIVEGRKGNIWYHVKVQGKEAHAGRDHKAGINACAILAQKIIELQKLTDYKKMITVSIIKLFSKLSKAQK